MHVLYLETVLVPLEPFFHLDRGGQGAELCTYGASLMLLT